MLNYSRDVNKSRETSNSRDSTDWRTSKTAGSTGYSCSYHKRNIMDCNSSRNVTSLQ